MTAALVCVECRAETAGDAVGWRAYRADLDEVATYCPVCAAREFDAVAGEDADDEP